MQFSGCNILAISEEEFDNNIKMLMFVGMVKFSKPKDFLLIPDENKLKDFMAFLRNKVDETAEEGEELGITGDKESDERFEKIYNVLCRKKL